MSDVDPEIVRYYSDTWNEDARLRSGLNELELIRTREILRRQLSAEGGQRILDVGGGGGVHAEWLLADGHVVHLVDPVPRHIEEANGRLGSHAGFSAEIADARQLPCDSGSFDAVLLLGPLYHLTELADRNEVWSEALRCVRRGGTVAAAAITRFASLLVGLSERVIFDDGFRAMVDRDLASGVHTNPTRRPEWFTTSYFHRPEELAAEAGAAGLDVQALLGVEGPAGVLPELATDWEDPIRRKIIVDTARSVESEPSLLGLGPHILVIGRNP